MTSGSYCGVETARSKLLSKGRTFETKIMRLFNWAIIEDLQDLLIVFSVPEIIIVIKEFRIISILIDLIQVSLGAVHS